MRQRAAEYRPKSSSAAQGAIHKRNLGAEQRDKPRAMNCLSIESLGMDLLLSGARLGRGGDLPHPVLLRPVVNLRLGVELLQQTEALRLPRFHGNCAGRVVQVAEMNRSCRTRFGAGRYIVHRLGIGLSSGGRGFLGGMPASMTEIAFLHHPAHARSYAGIQSFLHARGPGWIPPVEVAGMIRTGCHTVAAT